MLSNKHMRTTSFNNQINNIGRRLKHGTTEGRGGMGVISSMGNLDSGKYFSKKSRKFTSPTGYLNKKQRSTFHKSSHVKPFEGSEGMASSFRGKGRFNRVRESGYGSNFVNNPSSGVKSSRNLKYTGIGFGSPDRKLDYRGSKFGYLKINENKVRVEDMRNLSKTRRFLSENKTFGVRDNKENAPKVSQLNFYNGKQGTPLKVIGNSFSNNIQNLSSAVSPMRKKIQISKRGEASPSEVLREIRVSSSSNGANFFNDDESTSRVTTGLNLDHRLTKTSLSRMSNTSCGQPLSSARNTITRSSEYRVRTSEVSSSVDYASMKESLKTNQSCFVQEPKRDRENVFGKFTKNHHQSVFAKGGKNRYSKSSLPLTFIRLWVFQGYQESREREDHP